MTPHGSLRLDQTDNDFVLEGGLADRLEKSFERGSGHGLLHLGAGEAGSVLPPSLAWWRDFGMRYIADLCALGDAKGLAAPTSSKLAALINDAPPMRGGEYLGPDVLAERWGDIGGALEVELSESGLTEANSGPMPWTPSNIGGGADTLVCSALSSWAPARPAPPAQSCFPPLLAIWRRAL
jgi:hypothetical protein